MSGHYVVVATTVQIDGFVFLIDAHECGNRLKTPFRIIDTVRRQVFYYDYLGEFIKMMNLPNETRIRWQESGF